MRPCSCAICGIPVKSGVEISYSRVDLRGVAYVHDECVDAMKRYMPFKDMRLTSVANITWNYKKEAYE